MLYVGVDAHKAHSQMTVIDEAGTILERRRAKSTREGVLEKHCSTTALMAANL